jgi:iron(III) transport system substrate-binding protein
MKVRIVLLLAGLLAAVPFSSPLAAQSVDAAASKEGRVVWYAAPGTAAQVAPILDAWTKVHPDIKVEIVEGPGPDMMERVRTEARSKRPVADLMSLGDIAAWPAVEEGLYQPYTTAGIPNEKSIVPRLQQFKDKQQRIVPMYLMAYGITVNTKVLPQSQWPQTWRDVLKPAYADKIGVHDPSIIGGGLVWYMVGQPVLGDAYFRELLEKQKARVFPRLPALQSSVESGERAVIAPASLQNANASKDAPIKWIAPKDGLFFITYYIGVVQNAAHPNAAQTFVNFLLNKDSQREFATTGEIPVVTTPNSPLDLKTAHFLGAGATTPTQGQHMADWLKAGQKLVNP